MKKVLITIIILLIVLMFGQLIYYKINKTDSNISSVDEQADEENLSKDKLYIKGMSVLYDNYNPGISFEDLEAKFYEFVSITVPDIYDNVRYKSIDEIKQYYKDNTSLIDSMDIYNEEEFIMIANQIKNNLDEESIVDDYSIDTNTVTKLQNGLIYFEVEFIYDNQKEIQISIALSEKSENIKILSATGLDKIFMSYNGGITKIDVLKKIDSFISNIKDLRYNSTLKTESERRQYFDLNKEELEKIGITSQDDYLGIVIQINVMRWREQDLHFEKYEINSENISDEENYQSFELMIYYNYNSSLHLKISISNGQSVTPSFKISSYESE